MAVRTASSPAGTFSNTTLSCSGSANSFLTCSGNPVSIPANTFVDIGWNGAGNGAASGGVFTYAICH
jgi:hypothetical protein